MGHELRTPLHAIIGFAEVLLDETVRSSEAERREFVEHIVRGGKHLLGIVNEVLDLSRIEAGRMELRRCPLAVADLVDEVAVTVRPLAEEKRIHVARDVGPGLPAAWADPARVRQVLMNLVGNALKFTPAGGRVVLGARAAANGTGMGRWIEVSVADTGIGIPPEEHDRIFEEFQQVPGVEGEDQGTGLGLALAKRIVELHGGAIRVLSAPGRGSTFAFTLPTVTPA
jgi:signal transduction histidine kinase